MKSEAVNLLGEHTKFSFLKTTIKWREQRPKAKTTNFPLLFCSRCTGRVFRVVLGCEFGIPPLPPCCTPPFKHEHFIQLQPWGRDVSEVVTSMSRNLTTLIIKIDWLHSTVTYWFRTSTQASIAYQLEGTPQPIHLSMQRQNWPQLELSSWLDWTIVSQWLDQQLVRTYMVLLQLINHLIINR